MKKLSFTLAALVALTLSLSSCKKDADSPAPVVTKKTKTELLTAGSWVMTGMKTNSVDLFPFLPNCQKDNFFTFKANGTYIDDEGKTKCDLGDPQTSTGSWKFIANETKIVLDGLDTSTIESLNGEAMVIKSEVEDDEGKRSVIISTFTIKK